MYKNDEEDNVEDEFEEKNKNSEDEQEFGNSEEVF